MIFRYLFRGILQVIRAETLAHADLRRRLSGIVVLTLLVAVAGTVSIFLIENGRPGTGIATLWDAFLFTASQLITLSSLTGNPATHAGQIIVLLVDIYALTVVSTVAGMFGAFFFHRSDERRREASDNVQGKKRDERKKAGQDDDQKSVGH